MTRKRSSKPARQRVHILGIIDENGALTNAGALLADDSPIHQSRIFCTRWNGLTMTSGLGEALDDAELEGSVIGQLQDAVAFMRNNSNKRWWKESDHREELPDYPERAVTEVTCNAIIHRDYQELGSEIHIDIYDPIAENLGVSTRQVQKYLRRLTELHLIAREGGRKNGIWKIIDKDYDDFTS